VYRMGHGTKVGSFANLGLQHSPSAKRWFPESVAELVAVSSTAALVCEKPESTADWMQPQRIQRCRSRPERGLWD